MIYIAYSMRVLSGISFINEFYIILLGFSEAKNHPSKTSNNDKKRAYLRKTNNFTMCNIIFIVSNYGFLSNIHHLLQKMTS